MGVYQNNHKNVCNSVAAQKIVRWADNIKYTLRPANVKQQKQHQFQQ